MKPPTRREATYCPTPPPQPARTTTTTTTGTTAFNPESTTGASSTTSVRAASNCAALVGAPPAPPRVSAHFEGAHIIVLIAVLQVLVFATHVHTQAPTSLVAGNQHELASQQQQQQQSSQLLVVQGQRNSSSRRRPPKDTQGEEDQEDELVTGHSSALLEPSEEHKRLIVRELKANLLRCLELEEEPAPVDRQADARIPHELLERYLSQREQMRPIVPSDEDFYGRLPRAHPLVKRHAAGGETGTGRRSQQPRNRQHQQAHRYTRIADKCAKRNMKIKFDHVGWSDWIIAPASYNAYYCAGECSYPMSDYQNATNHAIIQSIFHSVGRVVPRSCCAPIKMGKIAILYQLDGNVHMRQYDDMVVETCGCL